MSKNADTREDNSKNSPTPESVLNLFNDLIGIIDDEIKRIKESPTKTKGCKFLRSIKRRVITLRTQHRRILKQKRKTQCTNRNYGFQKPVQISNELAEFTGWPKEELRSRVDVTKYICNYITENNLQNPQDRRQIIPDNKLQKLLGFNPKKSKEPLKYYTIQSCLKNQGHFIS
jgi:chromatin remodeling complex protein RSC6